MEVPDGNPGEDLLDVRAFFTVEAAQADPGADGRDERADDAGDGDPTGDRLADAAAEGDQHQEREQRQGGNQPDRVDQGRHVMGDLGLGGEQRGWGE